MPLYDGFTNLQSMSKTLRFELQPVGDTQNLIDEKEMLREDFERSDCYPLVKKMIDEEHKKFIDAALSGFRFSDKLKEYVSVYEERDTDGTRSQKLDDISAVLRKEILAALKKHDDYSLVTKPAELISKRLLIEKQGAEKEAVYKFNKFAMYFTGLQEARGNMYTDEEKSTAIPYRAINDNLPKFLDNVISFRKISAVSEISEYFEKIEKELDIGVFSIRDFFTADFYSFAVAQRDIERYNMLIGGKKTEDEKQIIEGLNQYINKYNQTHPKERLPLLKPLYKQILSDRESLSFIPEKFSNDNELLQAVRFFYSERFKAGYFTGLFGAFDEFDMSGIYIRNGQDITDISQKVFGEWGIVNHYLSEKFDKENTKKFKSEEEKDKARNDYCKSHESISVSMLEEMAGQPGKVSGYISETVRSQTEYIGKCYSAAEALLDNNYPEERNLISDQDSIALIKELLDSIKELHRIILTFRGSGKETDKDEVFYGEYDKLIMMMDEFTPLYDKVRNYLTQKPYSEDKIKVNFGCSSLLNGWGQNYKTNAAHIFEMDGCFYLGIAQINLKSSDLSVMSAGVKNMKHIIYEFQKPDNKNTPRTFVRSKGTSFAPAVKEYDLPVESIIDIYDSGKFKTQYRKKNEKEYKESLAKIIDYFKLGLKRHESYKDFDFMWKPTEEYNDIAEFYSDSIASCYRISKEDISYEGLLELVRQGKFLLFRIYNKDFSKDSKGKPNLHTLYWRILFSEENRKGYPFRLNGGAEVFYRKASLHYSDEIMQNGHHYDELKCKFSYPIIKDRRYTCNKYFLHVPITINAVSQNVFSINNMVNAAVYREDNINVIGIDRGERNLLYVSVIDSRGNIIEQRSLNVIGDKNTDYQKKLADREKKRQENRQSWSPVKGIKNLKEGYLSQVVHIIAKLMVKYNAVLFMEDLNAGMKHSRVKFERQVYDKFENALVSKLCFYVDKEINIQQGENAPGGLLRAYQLANVPSGKKDRSKQNGFIFYIPAWNTSKIDPVTGFVNLFDLNLTSKQSIADFFGKFRDIRYNSEKKYYEFTFDYHDFGNRAKSDYRNSWTVCTFGKRIREFRNKDKNNQWDTEDYYPTDKLTELLKNHNIPKESETLKENILSVDDAKFYKELLYIFRLTLQMRNSVPGSTKPEDDYIISPVADRNGIFYDSREYDESSPLPCDADANGAYNIARKGLWVIGNIKAAGLGQKFRLSIKNDEWLELAQKGDMDGGGTDSNN